MLLLLLLAEMASAASCNEFNTCNTCVMQPSGLSTCRWCPVDRVCHAMGSGYNPCTVNQNIKDRHTELCPAEPRTTNFSLSDALYSLELSNAAYLDAPWTSFLPTTFYTNSSYFFKYDISTLAAPVVAFLGWDTSQKRIYITFRGTDKLWSLQLIEEILNRGSVPFPQAGEGVLLNVYFAVGAFNLVAMFTPALNHLIDTMPGYSLWLTGHSLGGAMASVAAVELVVVGGVKLRPIVYTFGAPRSGNYAFAQVFTAKATAYRVVNNWDAVPHVTTCASSCDSKICVQGLAPLCGGGCCVPNSTEYHAFHHPTEIWFSGGNYQNKVMCGYRECTGANSPAGGPRYYGEDQSCSDHVEVGTSFTDHSGYWDVIPMGWCNPKPPLAPGP